jgi:enoyl-CoA hydratase/carnithine racemase
MATTVPSPAHDGWVPSFETLIYDVRDGKAFVTLDRPQHHNTFDQQMQRELRALWEEVKDDRNVRVVVLTGAGDKAFCAGLDRNMQPLNYENREFWHREDPSVWVSPKTNRCWKPVVCAVNGMACGGGFYLLAEADVIIAADHATFFDPHVTFAMTAVLEPVMLAKRMPFGEVMRMALLGNDERISARRALEIGLVSEVVPGPDLAAAAEWIADRIAEKDPNAVQGTVRALWASLEVNRAILMDLGFPLATASNMAAGDEKGQPVGSQARREWRLR